MKIEKKLIACSILALIIGVSSVLPMVFFMSATAKAETSNEPWFSINVPYAYWVTNDGPLDYDFGFSFPRDFEMNETNSVSEEHMVVLNLTLNVDTTNEPTDARIEYYQIDVSSDKGPVENMHWQVGTNSNSSFGRDDFHFMRDDWFDTEVFDPLTGGGGGLIRHNWTAGLSILWPEAGSGSGTIGSSGTSRVVSALREAETVFISVYRIGWVTFTDNSTIVTLANNELVDQIQLEKFGDGFLYNNLVPEDELATIDLLDPIGLLHSPPE
jgi:hypothetical protein